MPLPRRKAVLVTGANGEMGHGLIQRLAQSADADVIALDIRDIDPELADKCAARIVGDILDPRMTT